jgi:hypothetical protein
MRKIDWDKKLSDEDVSWLRQAGFMSEDRIANHQAQFNAEVPEVEVPEDEATRSALDAEARLAARVEGTGAGSPVLVDPTAAEIEDEDSGLDDYDRWKKPELEAEVKARNEMPDTSEVTVIGTGRDGAILKEDLVKGLRLWDIDNPDALKD